MAEENSELSGGIDRLVQIGIEKVRRLASWKIARDAVRLFVQDREQESVEPFLAKSPSQFNLKTLNPEAIFRHTILSLKHGEPYAHYWYVVGSENKNSGYPDIFRIETASHADERLRLNPNWKLKTVVPREEVFYVKEASRALGFPEQEAITDRIDMMSMGPEIKKEPPKRRSRRSLPKPQILEFAPQTISPSSH